MASTTSKALGKEIYKTVVEKPTPVDAEIVGCIPPWLQGILLRVGPGKFEWGDTEYNHWFDGDAIINKFEIKDGNVKCSSRFLRSNSFVESKKRGRIAMSQFATNKPPDPCKNIFARFMSHFTTSANADNCNVNAVKVKGEVYATGDLLVMWKIDPETLECIDRLNIEDALSGTRSWTSHPHFEDGGAYYNCSADLDKKVYEIVKIPSKKAGQESVNDLEVVASVPYKGRAAYMHSFSMTENYFILIEGSLLYSCASKLKIKMENLTHADLLHFETEMKSKLHLIDRRSGKVGAVFLVQPFMCFHQINAYERQDEVVFDTCFYPDATVIEDLYLRNLRSGRTKSIFPAEVRRYRLSLKDFNPARPVVIDVKRNPSGLDYELIHPSFEMPKINYEAFNGKKYQFTYGTGNSEIQSGLTTLIKINLDTKDVEIWQDDNCYPSEPEFVAAPNAKKEDEGVLLSAVLGVNGRQSFLLVLDAETMVELARAYVSNRLIPLFHVDFFSY